MSKKNSLLLLKNLAQTKQENVEVAQGKENKKLKEAEQKLELLLQYRDDYKNSHQEKMSAGINQAGIKNYNAFMKKLDEAISGQQAFIKEIESNIESLKMSWIESRKKTMSFGVMVDKHEQTHQKFEEKKERKAMDEYASRAKKSLI